MNKNKLKPVQIKVERSKASRLLSILLVGSGVALTLPFANNAFAQSVNGIATSSNGFAIDTVTDVLAVGDGITAGSISASTTTTGTLSATSATAGSISASTTTTGTLSATSATAGSISASTTTTGTLSACLLYTSPSPRD